MTGVAHQKVNAGHLKRNAYLYVRDDQGPAAAVWCYEPQYTRGAEID